MFHSFNSYLKQFIRKGVTYNKILKELNQTEFYSMEQLDNYNNIKLKKIIEHSYKYVPYYRELFDNLKLKPDDITKISDLEKLPFLEKRIVRDNLDKFLSKRLIDRVFMKKARTGGSTGTPLSLFRDYYSINFENASLWRNWLHAGDYSLKRVTLRGEDIVPLECKTPPFWKYSPATRELKMSSYHLNDETASLYIDKIIEFDPKVIYAYPSIVYQMALYFDKFNKPLKLTAVFTSSENLGNKQKKLIEQVFNCKVFDWYGQAERVSAIAHCEEGTYHIVEDYSITELIKTEQGLEVVGTSLNNYLMPLLRYRTGDIVELSSKKCSCGRSFRSIERINGRSGKHVITPEGIKIPIIILSFITDYANNIDEAQFIQNKKGEMIVKVVTNNKFTDSDLKDLIYLSKKYTSDTMKIEVETVSEIPRGPNGKFVGLISNIDSD
ncbi:phenylacetate--CoA ligase family protein [Pseudobacteroides cellulosolvens]|uniref:CapK related-protein n=1 Tax=Pseudobacteroides cellulosolvens ATCC 35603 = DSM 2933 TaxID=398512 RepID=A0A0L6JL57_9FIRM|nr:phenylacetate--CoA ligase family protein [Pseudobacteroides cellulosolvens]KNY26556.1 hypothetical protein Bccel_1821 [Pseudobacteroides cellulosolvens ATCC 35603 = DSM 2933]